MGRVSSIRLRCEQVARVEMDHKQFGTMDRSDILTSYRKTIWVVSAIFLVAAAMSLALAFVGGTLPLLVAGFGGLLATVAAVVAAGGLLVLRRERDQQHGKGFMPRPVDRPLFRHNSTTHGALRVGDVVEVRSAKEILATLDDTGNLDALPFMPEMLAYCGKRFVVTQCADKILDMIDKTGHRLRRMRRAVFLDNLRCDGSAHGGCQQACRTIWKTAWLRRVADGSNTLERASNDLSARAQLQPFTRRSEAVWESEPLYRCQATELLMASERMHAWDPRGDLRALTSGNVRFRDFVSVLLARAFNVVQELRGGASFPGYTLSAGGRTPQERLELQPGEWVEVKSLTEIASTLDKDGRNRGMRFDQEMVRYCGGRYQVRSRVDRLIDERTGRMLRLLNPCIILEDVEATGEFLRFNPQREYPYWREIWLRRIAQASDRNP
jgi:hypothetical protein